MGNKFLPGKDKSADYNSGYTSLEKAYIFYTLSIVRL